MPLCAPLLTLQVWMKPGGPTAVSKLYGVINQRIPAGTESRGLCRQLWGASCASCSLAALAWLVTSTAVPTRASSPSPHRYPRSGVLIAAFLQGAT